MKQFFFFTLLLANLSFVNAQVLNVENLRSEKDSAGISGSIGLNINLIKNTKNIFSLGNTNYIQYKKERHLLFFISDIAYKKVDNEAIVDNGTYHLRYNYKWNEWLSLEAFAQSYNNSISNIDQRQLVGAGTRFRLSQKEKYKMILGTILMFEHEKEDNAVAPIYHDDFRLSTYFTFTYFPSENLTFKSTTFFQPRLDKFNDYRVHSYNSLTVKLIDKLALSITYVLSYDTYPAATIPNTQYELLNGIVYSFD
jgi:hypothetical protein